MIIDLKSIEHETEIDSVLGAEEIDLKPETVRIVSDVVIKTVVKKSDHKVDAEGRLQTDVEADCDRCLEPTKRTLNIEFHLAFVTPEHFPADKDTEISGEDLDVDILKDDSLDLNEIVREQILLNLPQQVFCKVDCKGLCAKCGANLNLIDCNCNETEIDPRWAVLKNLK